MVAALVANVCLIVRFLEKRVKQMTIVALCLLSVHGLFYVFARSGSASNRDFIYYRLGQCSHCHRFRCGAQIQRRIYIWPTFLVGSIFLCVRISYQISA